MGKFDEAKLQKKINKFVEQVNCQDGRKAPRCEYVAMGERCTFAGTLSPQIQGEGSWYCRFHYQQLEGHLTEAEAAENVRERFVNRNERNWREDVVDAKIKEMGDDPLMNLAHALARGGCSREDKADFLGLLRGRMKGLLDLPYEKSNREAGARQENVYEDMYQ